MNVLINLQLTREEAHKLEIYLLMTTRFRTGEAEALEKLASTIEEENGDEVTVTKLRNNAKFWEEQCEIMDAVQARLQSLLTSPAQLKDEDGRGEHHE